MSDNTGPPTTASCITSGGTITFKTAIGIFNPGGYVAPTKNKGQKIAIDGVDVC